MSITDTAASSSTLPWPLSGTGFNAVPASAGMPGCEMTQALTLEAARQLADAGVAFCVRTLAENGGLTAAEACLLRDSGLGIVVVYPLTGSIVSADNGRRDSLEAVQWAKAAGVPPGASLFCRLSANEGIGSAILIDYLKAWSEVITSVSYIPGLCVSNDALTREQLTGEIGISSFFQDGEPVTVEPEQGYQILSRTDPAESLQAALRSLGFEPACMLAIQRDNQQQLPWLWPARSPHLPARLSGTELIAQLTQASGNIGAPANQQAILDWVSGDNAAPVSWIGVTSEVNGHELTFFASADALRLGTVDDSVRVDVTAEVAQQIADRLGCVLETTRICDLIWKTATVKATPTLFANGPDGSITQMQSYNEQLDNKVASDTGLIENIGKRWLITDQLASRTVEGQPAAANYGFYMDSGTPNSGPARDGPYHVIQSLGFRHFSSYTDYSQVMRLIARWCIVDGARKDLVEVMMDPNLFALASDEAGPMTVVRQPGVEPPCVTALIPAVFATTRPSQQALAAPETDSEEADDFVQAKFFQQGRNDGSGEQAVRLIVFHTAEQDCQKGMARNVAHFFCCTTTTKVSAHYVVGPDETIQCVREADTAWQAFGSNFDSIGLEHTAWARYSPEDWASTCSQTMLDKSAKLAADICRRHGLPAEYVDAAQLSDPKKKGITTHADVSRAFGGTHADPGADFPLDDYLSKVKGYMA